MNKRDRKQKLLLISNGGFLDSLEEGWESVKKTVQDFDTKKTIEQVFGDSKKEEHLEKKISPESKRKVETMKQDLRDKSNDEVAIDEDKKDEATSNSFEEMAKSIAKEIKDLLNFKEQEEKALVETSHLIDSGVNLANQVIVKPLEGYIRATGSLPSNANEECKKLLSLPMGSMKSLKLNDGVWYIAVVEEHFDNHPKGGGDPYRHKGVSLYEPIDGVGEFRV